MNMELLKDGVKKYWLHIAGCVVVLGLVGGIVLSTDRDKPAENLVIDDRKEVVRIFEGPVYHFRDDELGVEFDYPQSWGVATALNPIKHMTYVYVRTPFVRRIVFSNMPDVYLEAESIGFDHVFEEISAVDDEYFDFDKEYCGVSGLRSKNRGVYSIAECSHIIDTIKAVESVMTRISNEQNPKEVQFKVNKQYYTRIKNPLYHPLVLHRENIAVNNESNELKGYDCNGVFDDDVSCALFRENIEYVRGKMLMEIESHDLIEKEIQYLFSTMKFTEVSMDEAREYLVAPLNDLAEYRTEEYSFMYPKVWGEEFAESLVRKDTYEYWTSEQEEACSTPEGRDESGGHGSACGFFSYRLDKWISDRESLANNAGREGEVECYWYCEIKEVNKVMYMTRYEYVTQESSILKTYSTYKDNLRYYIEFPYVSARSDETMFDGMRKTDHRRYKAVENQIYQQAFQRMFESIVFY